ncbi:Aspartyl/asparaginyl beta-hydroxylase [Stylophora pistillata]|uniref:Aspartyl/asparaginyl beta-hydroxylase n=1 Tax=Stylophora pistillata TaxID=50429 RepID=A0A2B4SH42_STYPI|nr:Aspartyl/asparaginyl beta-hydroxylase [Stylophora pistillata]
MIEQDRISPYSISTISSRQDVNNSTTNETTKTSSESSNFSTVKWIAFVSIIFVLVLLVAVYIFRTNQGDSNLNQNSRQIFETEKGSFEKTEKKNKKTKPSDSKAAITNSYDKSITKELDKAQSILDKDQIADALQRFEALTKKYPKSPRAMYGKAQSLDKLAEQRQSNNILLESIETYRKAADTPNCPTELKRRAVRRQAERLSFLGRSGQAANVLRRLLDELPGDIEVMNELGVQYLMTGKNRDAENIYNQAYKVYEEAAGKGIFLSALQRSLYNADTPLTARPWWTPEETGYERAIRKLEANWEVIKDEGISLLDKKSGGFIPEEENLREQGDWKQFTLYQRGRKNAAACQKTPQTCAIIDTIKDATSCKRGQIKYSVMLPGTHVWPHTGPTNCRLRLHLGLVIPNNVAIRVGRETRTWEEGKALIIDDSFDHEVWHNGSTFRLILIVDFWHPDLTPRQRNSLSPI